jgi:Protein of unknown function (DUF2700)
MLFDITQAPPTNDAINHETEIQSSLCKKLDKQFYAFALAVMLDFLLIAAFMAYVLFVLYPSQKVHLMSVYLAVALFFFFGVVFSNLMSSTSQKLSIAETQLNKLASLNHSSNAHECIHFSDLCSLSPASKKYYSSLLTMQRMPTIAEYDAIRTLNSAEFNNFLIAKAATSMSIFQAFKNTN